MCKVVVLKTELKQGNLVEQEQIMEIVTSWMQKGIEQGKQKIVKRQLKRRLNNIDSTLENRIDSLSVEQIENLADAIFDFQSLEDLTNWLDQQD